jgi:hypothetical protein
MVYGARGLRAQEVVRMIGDESCHYRECVELQRKKQCRVVAYEVSSFEDKSWYERNFEKNEKIELLECNLWTYLHNYHILSARGIPFPRQGLPGTKERDTK